VEDEGQERQLNIHLDPENLAGGGHVPGVVVARVNMSTRFMRELLDAMQDSWSKWSSREGIRNLPETPGNDNDS
jgi:hypothetical protein